MTLQKLGRLRGALLALSSAALSLTAVSARAETGHTDTDARCLAVSIIMASSTDNTAKTLGPQGVTYFLGRIDGRGGQDGLKPRLQAQFAAFHQTPQSVSASVQKCMGIMHERAVAFRAVTDQILGPASPPPPAQPSAPPAAGASH